MNGSDEVVIGVDIGTTATKVIAYDASGASRASASTDYRLREPEPGAAVQDPHEVAAAVRGGVRAVVRQLDGVRVAGLSFSSAMHSLLGLDRGGNPLTPLITWADTRAAAQADRLHDEGRALDLQKRTGTPVHPMSPLVKLMWLRETDPELHGRAVRWDGIKEFVLGRWCGSDVTDHSVASATGMLALDTLDWDAEALELAGITRDRLPEPVPVTTVIRTLTTDAAAELGLPAGTPVVVGASDGPLANLGIGAVHPGQTACSIGTSAALRVIVEKPAVDENGGVFCYAFVPGRYVVGGALNNGGVVLDWLGDALAPELGEDSEGEMAELAATAPPGSAGLLMLPYLLGERAPHWSSLPRGAYVGLTRAHRREHLARAALEGVCLQLSLVLASMDAAGIEVRQLRATGGFARSPFWRQLLADVLGVPVNFPTGHEGSAFGAALLGMEALGLVDSIDRAADLVRIESTLDPDPLRAELYRQLRPVFGDLFDRLTPTFRELRRLAPLLAADPSAR
ncbi:MAG TPA: gluconokinase [Kineosporiaceae bacterium]|nr:gluconokinase [Kineosporiaceae bacterium]